MGDNIRKLSSDKIELARQKAKEVDLTIVVVGDNSMRYKWKDKTAGENMACSALNLAGKQLDLIKAVHQSGKPYLVVLVNGKPIAEPWLYEKATAVIESWEAGSFAGEAIAKIIFGEANPSGKLPLTIPRSVGQLPNDIQSQTFTVFSQIRLRKIQASISIWFWFELYPV